MTPFGIILLLFALLLGASLFVLDIPSRVPEKTPLLLKETPDIKNFEEKKVETLPKVEVLKEAVKILTPVVPSPPPLPPPPPPPSVKSDDLYQKALKALVNIFCEDNNRGVYILGSGTIINPGGYILTNAHLAENFGKENVDCRLRRGSPAQPFARAEVILLPDQTKTISKSEIPEKDIAILKITEFLGSQTKPETFEYFEFDPAYVVKESEVLYSLGYPTEFLGSITLLRETNILFSLGTIENLVTVDEDPTTAEGAYLKGEISAQHGSSGGIFLEAQNGKVVGLFVGITEGKTTAERNQFMFLSSYVDRIVREEKGMGFKEFLDSNP